MLCSLLTGSPATLAGGLAPDDADGQAFEQIVQAYHDADQFAGSVLTIKSNEVVYAGGFGPANRSWGIPNDPDTRFRICSLTKQFTATLVMQLVGEGKIDLEDPITTHLPWYRRDTGDRISIRQLLQHMSGLPEPVTMFDQIDDAMAVADDAEQLITQFASGDLQFEPGTSFNYSNADFYVLGAIIEAVDNRTFADALQARILDPLEMNDSGLLRFETVIPRLATGYKRVGETFEHRIFFGQLGYAAAGMYSSANDLGRWNLALLNHTILSKELTEQMFTPVVVEGQTGNYVALGSWVYKRPLPPDRTIAPRIVERRGYIEPFTILNVLCPDEMHAIVILSNNDPSDIHALPYADGLPLDLLQLLYDREATGPK